ncbi:MAG: hypothetical protein ACREOI_01195 [bacterium]
MSTEELIKRPILEILSAEELREIITPSIDGPREYSLVVNSFIFRADFAFDLPDGSWLFIEDDDAQRAVSNLAKYWMWMGFNKINYGVHLFHIIGPGLPSHKELCQFISAKISHYFPAFQYELIVAKDWKSLGWREELKDLIHSLANKF